MECLKFLVFEKVRERAAAANRLNRKGGKLTRAVYAGLIVCFVPSVLCQDWSRRLTFDEIYNDTNYVQLQQRPRPYRITEYTYDITHIHPIQDNSHRHSIDNDRIVNSHRINVEHKRITNNGYNLGIGINSYRTNEDKTSIVVNQEHNVDNGRIVNGYRPYLDDKRAITKENYGVVQINGHFNKGDTRIANNNGHSFKDYEIILDSPRFNTDDSTIRAEINSHRQNLDEDNVNGFSIEENYNGNEVDLNHSDVIVSDIIKEPLLVGFSHDPYRYSVPEEDYLKGVRDMTPKSIMSKGENRGKRGVLHLYNMMYCATGCEPLAYKGYGCYCGFLGSGKPTDGIDRCCKMHDECYENIVCPFFTVYFQPYYWKCYRGQPLCARENYHSQHQFINGCAGRLCECDRRFAMCVKRYACPRRRALCHSSPLRLLQNLLMF